MKRAVGIGGVLALGLVCNSAIAVNITINDNNGGSGTYFGGGPLGKGGEDQETEPGTSPGQIWDLEAFTLNGSTLRIYSGFNLLAGEGGFALGDIFIDVDGDAKYGAAGAGLALDNSQFKYDYVMRFNNRNGQTIGTSFDILQINEVAGVTFNGAAFAQNNGSNPFTLKTGGTLIGSGTMAVTTDLTSTLTLEDGTQVKGGTHYIGALNLAGIPIGDGTLFHLTLGCGNDNLMGKVVGQVPDAGSAAVLLGMGLGGLALFGWRSRRQS